MTGRTHDLAAFTAVTALIAYATTLPHISLSTGIVAFGANMIGGLAPDIDQPTGALWRKLPAGTLYSRLFTPFLGGHRFLSHSIAGFLLFGFLAHLLLQLISHVLLVNITIVWWSFLIGYASHLVMDTITREGVPWLFPIPIHFGIPPLAILRMKTGGFIEKLIVFPGLLILNGYFFYTSYPKFIALFHKLH
jgi:inner membrane protein